MENYSTKQNFTDEEYKILQFVINLADEKGYDYKNIEFFMSDFINLIGKNISNLDALNEYAEQHIRNLQKKYIIFKEDGVEIHKSVLSSYTHDLRNAKITLSLNTDKRYLLNR